MTSLHVVSGIHWGYTLSLLGVLALMALTAGVLIGRATGRRTRPTPRGPVPAPGHKVRTTPVSHGNDPVRFESVAKQRDALISGCVQARALLDDQLLTAVLDDTLRLGGVQIVDPAGSRANPAEHRTAGTDPASSPAQDGVISRTLRPGFLDAGRVVRAADVVVYKWEN